MSNPAQVARGNILQNLDMESYLKSNNILFKMNCNTKVEKYNFLEENKSFMYVNMEYAKSDSSFFLEISQRSYVHE